MIILLPVTKICEKRSYQNIYSCSSTTPWIILLKMPGGRRILSRIQSSSYPSNNVKNVNGREPNMIPLASMVVLPKHSHLPEIPGNSNMSFEAMMYMFGVIVMGLQYINLYKTVWWLPHSHANYALNFYLIDPYLVSFLCVLMNILVKVQQICDVLVGTIGQDNYGVSGGHSTSIYSLPCHNKSLAVLFFIFVLMLTYILLFGPSVKPLYLKTLVWPSPVSDRLVPRHKNKDNSEYDINLYHNCTLTPDIIRSEVEMFKTDFNNRIKQVLFNSLLTAYYMTFVPLCFAQNTLYYDTWWVGQHVCMTWISAFLMLIVHFLPPKYLDLLHKCALHLGRWQRVEGRHAHVPYNAWSELTVWPQGALVKHVRGLFKAEGINVTAEPGNGMHGRFYFLFHQPMRVVNWLLVLTWLLVGYQFFCLIQSTEWSHIICVALVLFCNYYTLFKLLRDRIILAKTYREETSIDQ
ncbi:hypothetical protein KUTeg_006591 [Tegillarca granosa]|uniref:Transmembrane protein 39A n=1 Tax=Tegillarca granosa TaxID=220873 RepID=A0ABQ9FDZ6_TEGGR|nr:hypothetical protein KUTeg_006591 [Tegillarca granosa]